MSTQDNLVREVCSEALALLFVKVGRGSTNEKLQRQSSFGEDQHGAETESAEISRLLRVINQLLSSSWDFLQITVSSSGFIWKEDIGASDPPDKSSCSKCVHGSVFIPCPWRLTHWNKLLSPQIESNISLLQKHQFERLWLVCTAWTICSSCSVSSVRHLWHVFLWCVVVITARAAVWAAGRWPSLFCWQILLDIWDT